MRTIIIGDLVPDTSLNSSGEILFNELKKAKEDEETVSIGVGNNIAMSSSFLNSSIGKYLESYGLNSFKENIKFKGSKTQFERLSSYVDKYIKAYNIH